MQIIQAFALFNHLLTIITMFKKTLITIAISVAVIAILAPYTLGFSLWHTGHAIKVATSLTAKLACSARYISGFSTQQIAEDLASYSPVTRWVNLHYDDELKFTQANLFTMAPVKAQYTQAKGCSLVNGKNNTSNSAEKSLVSLTAPPLSDSTKPWPEGSSVETIAPTMQQVLKQLLAQDNANELNTRAMVIVKNGEIIAEAYSDGIFPSTPLLGWSMTKSVTAMLLGRMAQLGMVSMDRDNLFQEWQQDRRKQISLQDLLQMSSGLAFDETYAPGSDATHMLFTADSASEVAMASPVIEPKGEHFSYSSGTTNLLARFIHQQFGHSTQSAINFLFNELFIPLGLQNSVLETDASGVFVGSSYLYGSARDWARLGLLMLNQGSVNQGKANQQRLLTKEWIRNATTPNRSNNDKRYGYQFWLNYGEVDSRWPSLPRDAYAMNGNRGQSVMIIPSEQVVFVRLGWTKGNYPKGENFSYLLGQLNSLKMKDSR
ncbi:serine hydrolase [Thalassotalea sp. G2M2-11]|uniref:serine hydrolase domain-containing protein n=1 Tax=Thalassotalea sp. G2M2-11 TaxID=2787627 RepID=UPI0019D0B95C|nr:serine hydrolase [Thalassotalea sp. G2M2-11]